MDAKRPEELIARAEVFFASDAGHIEVVYHWTRSHHLRPPPDNDVEECLRHGVGARNPLVQLAEIAWGAPSASFALSSPQFLRHPGGNYFDAIVRWDLVGAVRGCWRGMRLVVSFRDQHLLASLAPHRFDVFVTPWASDPKISDEFDNGQGGLQRVSERLDAVRGNLAELLAVAYQRNVISVELTEPRWEADCITLTGGHAFKTSGIVRVAAKSNEKADGP